MKLKVSIGFEKCETGDKFGSVCWKNDQVLIGVCL